MTEKPIGLQGRSFPYQVKTTADHWWPKGLQRLWSSTDGYISRVQPSGETDKKRPPKSSSKGFAHKRRGHKVDFGISPWNHTFEPEFDEIDNLGPPLVKQVLENGRTLPQLVNQLLDDSSACERIAKLCFSLLIRSPSFRARYAHAGAMFGLPPDERIAKSNMSIFWKSAQKVDFSQCNTCRMLFLVTKDAEFCFGDGLCDSVINQPISEFKLGNDWIVDYRGHAFVPLLPDLCVLLNFVRSGTGLIPELRTIGRTEVEKINILTQIYSKSELFYRNETPKLTHEFKKEKHLEVSEGLEAFIAKLLSDTNL